MSGSDTAFGSTDPHARFPFLRVLQRKIVAHCASSQELTGPSTDERSPAVADHAQSSKKADRIPVLRNLPVRYPEEVKILHRDGLAGGRHAEEYAAMRCGGGIPHCNVVALGNEFLNRRVDIGKCDAHFPQ